MLISSVDSTLNSRTLNIVHLIEPGSGGSLRHVIDLARAQADTGHHVTIIYSPLRLEAAYGAELQNLSNVTLHELPMHRAPHASDVKNLFKLVQILRRAKPDILHAHSTKAGLLARKARVYIKTKIIYTPHAWMSMNPDMPAWQKSLYAAYEKSMSFLTDRIIVLSRHEYEHALSLGISAKKLVMAQNGAPPLPFADRAALRAAANISDEKFVVGFIGRLSAQKNPELALQALAVAKQQNPNLILYMIGNGKLLPACQALAETLGIANDIRWLGAADARLHYAAMDLLLVTSRYEGMPYSFLEALQAGAPIVTTDVGGSESCIIPNQTGAIVPADASHIAREIAKIAGDTTIHDGMRFASRARAQNFGIVQMLESVTAVYTDALGE